MVELGFKGTFMDGRLRVNGAVFTTDYEDLQVQVFNSVAPVTQNVGKASIDGFEIEVLASTGQWMVGRNQLVIAGCGIRRNQYGQHPDRQEQRF